MIKKKNEIEKICELCPESGAGELFLTKLSECYDKPKSLRTFAMAELEVGGEVGYHVHTDESEAYYFLSGVGMYNDNGAERGVGEGDLTFTPSGQGHGIKNVGTEKLRFIALIILD